MHKKELKFVLNILKDNKTETEKNLDWYWITGFCELNKISGYFYNNLKKQNIVIPQSAERKLNEILRKNKYRNVIMRDYIQELSDELRVKGIRYAFLKGSVLSNINFQFGERAVTCMTKNETIREKYIQQATKSFYEDGERISNDIDILVSQKDISLLENLLKKMGFKQGYYDWNAEKTVELSRKEIISRRMNRGETAPFIKEINNQILPFIEVDINFSLGYAPASNKNMLTDIFENAINYSGKIIGGLKSLMADDFFLHLILHQYKESVLYSMVMRNKDSELYKYLDLYLFIKRGYIDIFSLYTKVKKYGIEEAVYSVFSDMAEIFSDAALSECAEIFKSDKPVIRKVIDPPTGRTFIWDNQLGDRIDVFNKTVFLKEVKENG